MSIMTSATSIVHRDFAIPTNSSGGGSSSSSRPAAAQPDAPGAADGEEEAFVSEPIHSWTHVSASTGETCLVTLSARRSLRLVGGGGSGDANADGSSHSSSGGVVWDVLYLPSSDNSHTGSSNSISHTKGQEQQQQQRCQPPPCSARFVFPDVPLSRLLVSRRRDGSDGGCDDGTDEELFSLHPSGGGGAAAAAADGGGPSSAAWTSGAPPVAKDCLVFLSARELVLYSGDDGDSTSSRVALDRFYIHSSARGWLREPRAVPLPPPSGSSSNNTPVDLLIAAAVPSAECADSTAIVYLLSSPTATTEGVEGTTFDLTAGVVKVSSTATVNAARGAGLSSSSCAAAPAGAYTDTAVPFSALVTPRHCHWKLLFGEGGGGGAPRLVGLAPMVVTKQEKGRRHTTTANSSSGGTPAVIIAYAVPEILAASQPTSSSSSSSTVVVTLHRQRASTGAMADGDAYALGEAMDELLSGDADELAERLATDIAHVYRVPLGEATHAPKSSGSSEKNSGGDDSVAMLLLEFVSEALRSIGDPTATHNQVTEGLYTLSCATATPASPPLEWRVLLDKQTQAGVEVLRVPRRYCVWTAGAEPVLMLSPTDSATTAAGGGGGYASSPFEVLPTTAGGGPSPSAVLCFPARHAITGALRLSYVCTTGTAAAAIGTGTAPTTAAPSLTCGQADSILLETARAVTAGAPATVFVPELMESLVATAMQMYFLPGGGGGGTDGARAAAHFLLASVWSAATSAGLRLGNACRAALQAATAATASVGRDNSPITAVSFADDVHSLRAAAASGGATPTVAARELAALSKFLFAALRAQLTQVDWLLAADPSSSTSASGGGGFMAEVYRCLALFFIGGVEAECTIQAHGHLHHYEPLDEATRRVMTAAVWCDPSSLVDNPRPCPTTTNTTTSSTCAGDHCAHWLRRLLLLHVCRRRGAPLDLLVEDIFDAACAAATAAATGDTNSSSSSSSSGRPRDGVEMEVALIQSADSAALLKCMNALAAPPRATGGAGGLLTTADLVTLYGARACGGGSADVTTSAKRARHPTTTTTTSSGSSSSPGSPMTVLGDAVALAPSAPGVLSAGFAPLLLDVMHRLETVSGKGGGRSISSTEAHRTVARALERWQAIVAGRDDVNQGNGSVGSLTTDSWADDWSGEEAANRGNSNDGWALPPVALPECLVAGPLWRQLGEYPWRDMPPIALFTFLAEVTDRIVAWVATATTAATSGGAWVRYWRLHGSSIERLRAAAHLLRWLTAAADGGDDAAASIAADLLAAMGTVASATAAAAVSPALADLCEPVTGASSLHLLGGSSSSNDDDDAGTATTAIGKGPAQAMVARVLHLTLANSTGRLLRRLVSLEGGSGSGCSAKDAGSSGPSSSSPTCQETQDRTLALLYSAGAGAEAARLAAPHRPDGSSDSTFRHRSQRDRTISRRMTPQAMPATSPHGSGAASRQPSSHHSGGSSEARGGVGTAATLRQLAAAVWTFALRNDPSAFANATLYEKLLDAFLWSGQKQQKQKQAGATTTTSANLFSFLRVVFLYAYPKQLALVEAALKSEHSIIEARGHDGPTSSHRRGSGSRQAAAVAALALPQYDSVAARSALASPPTSSPGEAAESTRHSLGRLLAAFADASLPARCLAALFSLVPSAAELADRAATAARRASLLGGRRKSRGDSSDTDSDSHESGNDDNDHSNSSGWFHLSPPTAFFVASQIVGSDVGRFAVAGELIRRELRSHVLSALFARGIFSFDPRRRGGLSGKPFDCRQFINDVAEQCETCGAALSATAPLYGPVVVLLFLDVAEELVVGSVTSTTRKGEEESEEEGKKEEDEEGASLYPAATVASMRECVARAAQKTYAPLHPDERARIIGLLRADFRPYLTLSSSSPSPSPSPSPDPAVHAAEVNPVTVGYELSAIHHRITARLAPALTATTRRMQQQQQCVDDDDGDSHRQRQRADDMAAGAVAGNPFHRERAAASAVVSGLRSALGIPSVDNNTNNCPLSATGAAASAGAVPTPPPALSSSSSQPHGPATTTSSSQQQSLQLQLLAKEEAARRRPLEASLAAEYTSLMSSAPVNTALATLYLAMRFEAYRRALVRHAEEQRDIIFTFESLYRERLAVVCSAEGRAAHRRGAMRRVAECEAVSLAEAEARSALVTECFTSKNELYTAAEQLEALLSEEELLRREWRGIEATDRAALARDAMADADKACDRQADREEQEEWVRIDASSGGSASGGGGGHGDDGGPPLPKNAFLVWQGKQLNLVPEPEDQPRHHRRHRHHKRQQYQVEADDSPTEEEEPIASGFLRVVSASDGIRGAFSLLQTRIRDTVAPAPQQQQRQQAEEEEQPTAAGNEDSWAWGDNSQPEGRAQAPPPPQSQSQSQPLPVVAALARVGEASWGWSDEDKSREADGEGEGPATVTAAVAPSAGKRKARGLGAVAVPPPQQQQQQLSTEHASGTVDSWGWDENESPTTATEVEPVAVVVVAAAVPTAAAAADERPGRRRKASRFAAVPLGDNQPPPDQQQQQLAREEQQGGASVPVPVPESVLQQQQVEELSSPATPNPARSLHHDIAPASSPEAAVEEEADSTGDGSQLAGSNRGGSGRDNNDDDAGSDRADDTDRDGNENNGGNGHRSTTTTSNSTEQESDGSGSDDSSGFMRQVLLVLEEDEDTERQMIRLEELCDYQHFKRSLILSYL